ncbi:MAG: hypothetical protein JXR88_05055 [Clostridia bacterium]|nr:hypothetical protein [Clostridia bacterium]
MFFANFFIMTLILAICIALGFSGDNQMVTMPLFMALAVILNTWLVGIWIVDKLKAEKAMDSEEPLEKVN